MSRVGAAGCAAVAALAIAACDPSLEAPIRYARWLLAEAALPPAPEAPSAEERAALETLRRGLVAEYQRELVAKPRFEEWVRDGSHEALERGYRDLFDRYRRGDISESTFRLILGWLAGGGDELAAPLDRWVEAYPDSWAARVARGSHRTASGFAARGKQGVLNTPEEAFVRMRAYFAAAKRDLTRAIELEPRVLESYADLIRIARSLGDQDACRKWADAAIRVNPLTYHTRVRYLVCSLPQWGGSYAKMRAIALDAAPLVERNPLLAMLGGWEFQDRADQLWRGDRHERALEQMDRALEYGPVAVWYLDHGRLNALLGRHDAAIRDFTEGLAYTPWCSNCLWRRAAAHAELGRGDAADRDFAAAIEMDPSNAAVYRQRGWIRERNDDLEGAVEDLELAAQLEPANHWVWRTLGWVHMKKTHDAARAQAAYRRLTELEPRNPRAWLNRAQAESMTREAELYASLERYLALVDRTDPENSETIREAERLLRERFRSDPPDSGDTAPDTTRSRYAGRAG